MKILFRSKPQLIQQMKEGVTIQGTFEYAGFWKRFSAKIVDNVLLTVITMPITLGLSATMGLRPDDADPETGETALMRASRWQRPRIMQESRRAPNSIDG